MKSKNNSKKKPEEKPMCSLCGQYLYKDGWCAEDLFGGGKRCGKCDKKLNKEKEEAQG